MSFQGSKSIPGEYYDLELAKSSSINSPAKEREQAISTCPDKEFIKQPALDSSPHSCQVIRQQSHHSSGFKCPLCVKTSRD